MAAAARRGGSGPSSAYEAIAPVYDDFTAHHEYEAVARRPPAQAPAATGCAGNRLLDVGCGTGKSFLPMLARGWEVTGCDISPAMLELAREKAGDAAQLSRRGHARAAGFGEFDLVWALDDAVNYLLSPEELERALSGMRANLAPDGLLLFDVNTLQAYRTFFAETRWSSAAGGD